MKNKLQSLWKKYWFAIIIAIIVLLKQWLVSQLPIQARDTMGVDQWKMLTRIEGLLNGSYWEQYSSQAMFKRDVLFPIFGAICHVCNVSYMAGLGILYTFCNLIVLYSFSFYSKNKYVLCILFLFLEFSPVSYSVATAQFFYNLALVAPLGIAIIASLMIAYNKRDDIRKFVVWNIAAGFFSMCIWLNREDSQWLLILIIVYMIVAIISMTDRKKYIKQKIKYYSCVFIPMFMVAVGNLSFCAVNYNQYGIFETNDHIATGFADAYNSLLKIQPESYPDACSITHDMLKRAMEQSSTLAELEEYIEKEYENGFFLKVGRTPDDGEIEDGWMPFVLREAAEAAGYYKNAKVTDQYWQTVSEEIEGAFDNGKLQERDIGLFGSMLKHPWVKGQDYFSMWMQQWKEILWRNIEHEGIISKVLYSEIESDIVKRYESVTYNNVVESSVYRAEGNGWIFMEDGTEIMLRIEDSTGEILQYVKWLPSPDIKEGFKDKFDIALENRRFVINCECNDEQNLFLVLYDADKEYYRIELKNSDKDKIEGIQWALDNYKITQVSDPAEEDAKSKVEIANNVGNIYRKLSWIMFGISSVIYMLACVKLVCNNRKKIIDNKLLSLWIYMTATIGCILVYTGAYAYIGAFMFKVGNYTTPGSGWFDFLYAICIICFAMFVNDYKKQKMNPTEN